MEVITAHAPPVKFADYLRKAIKDNFLMVGLVTSHTQARVKSMNLPYGLGKTTFGMWTSYVTNAVSGTYDPEKPDLHSPFDKTDPVVLRNWDIVFELMVYNVYDCAVMIEPGSKRKKLGLWDDVAFTAPAERGVPTSLYKFKGYVTTTRPELACLLMTASNRNEIAAPLRKLVLLEIIIAERGYYEVQKVQFYKNYRNPEIDKAKLVYLEEGTFPRLPDFVEARYNAWRIAEKRRIYPDMKLRLRKFVQIKEPVTFTEELEARVIKSGARYFAQLPKDVGEKLHLRHVKFRLPDDKPKGGDKA